MTTTLTLSRRRKRTRVEDQLAGVGQSAAQYRRERLPAHVRRPWHAGQQRAGRIVGATAGQQRARRGDQRAVRGLVDVLLHRPGHRAFRGVDGGVDGPADHDVRSLTRRRGRPIVPGRLGFGPADEMTGTTGACGRVGRGQLRFAVAPTLTVRRRLGDLQAALCQIQQRRADRLGQPVGQRAVDALSAMSVPTRPSRDSSTATTRG